MEEGRTRGGYGNRRIEQLRQSDCSTPSGIQAKRARTDIDFGRTDRLDLPRTDLLRTKPPFFSAICNFSSQSRRMSPYYLKRALGRCVGWTKLKPFGWDCRIVGRNGEGRDDDERRNERFACRGGRVSSGGAALGDGKYFRGAARNSRWVAAAVIYFSDVRVPEGRGIHAETYSRCGCVVQGAKSESDDAGVDDRFRGHSVIGAVALDGGDGAGRKAHLRRLLLTAESDFGEAVLAGRAVRIRDAFLGAGADRGAAWIFFRQRGVVWGGCAEIRSALWDCVPDGRIV